MSILLVSPIFGVDEDIPPGPSSVSQKVLENQSVGSVVGILQGIADSTFHRNAILHQGFQLDVASEEFLNLNQNAGLGTREISGERTYGQELRFTNVNSFKDAGIGITRNRGFQNLFAGFFVQKRTGFMNSD